MTNLEVHMFWAYGELSKLERLCISSFVLQGYRVNLWSYAPIQNAPKGVWHRDAREVLPEKKVFLNLNQSYVSFSDLFRYKLLNEMGGLYADTDVMALTSTDFFSKPLLVTQREKSDANHVSINNNIIYNPSPRKGNLIDMAYTRASRFSPKKISWEEIGTRLMSDLVVQHPEHGYELMRPDFANPFDYWKCPGTLITPGSALLVNSPFVHCYSSWWDRTGTDKNMAYPPGSLMASFEAKFDSLL